MLEPIDLIDGWLETLDVELAPDWALPAQLYPGPALQPEQRLLLAVLEDALNCLLPPSGRNAERDQQAARRWVFSPSLRPFGFVATCEQLGIDPGAVRQRLQRRLVRPMPRRAAGARPMALRAA